MRVHDGIYTWDGWGGKMKLGSGRCRLMIFDMAQRQQTRGVAPLKRHIVIVSDLPETQATTRRDIMSVKSCASHIATGVVRDFHLDRHRLVWIEHYPADPEDSAIRYKSAERFDEVSFEWKEDLALQPKWKTPSPDMISLVRELLAEEADPA